MTRVWTVKNGNGEPLLHLASGSPLAVGRKLVPAHYDGGMVREPSKRKNRGAT
jgi:hypothetical protein